MRAYTCAHTQELGLQLPKPMADSVLLRFAPDDDGNENEGEVARLECTKLRMCLCGEGGWHMVYSFELHQTLLI